jgi:integrase/recombinase XerD
MPQAKTFTSKEFRRVLDHVATRKHAARNRAMILMTHLAGLRVGEVALLKFSDVVDDAGKAKSEIRLTADQTKGDKSRIVFVSERLRKEVMIYVSSISFSSPGAALFYTQKRKAFTPNTLCQTMNAIYKAAGIYGATSHSGRRSFITALAAKGVGVRVLAALAGHRSISTTQAYIDVNDEMQRAAVELI